MDGGLCPCLRSRAVEFLIRSTQLLEVSPIVKYSALTLFADRFCPAFSSTQNQHEGGRIVENWLIRPLRESNLQLFALVSIWISSKIHDTPPLSVKSLKILGDKLIEEQHYTKGDLLAAVSSLCQFSNILVHFFDSVIVDKESSGDDLNAGRVIVLKYGIGMSNIAFVVIEELLSQLKAVAQERVHVKLEVCMDIMDLLYEKEVASLLHSSAQELAASILVVAYVTTVPLLRWEFPVLPWVKFVTGCKEEDILHLVTTILNHVL